MSFPNDPISGDMLIFLGGFSPSKTLRDSRVFEGRRCAICFSFAWMFIIFWLVVSTHLKKISQIGNLPQVGVKIKNI